MDIMQSIPQRPPDGSQEELYWWFPRNGDDKICVEDRKEGIIVEDTPQNGETAAEVLRRVIAEIGRLSLALREKLSPSAKPSGTMPK